MMEKLDEIKQLVGNIALHLSYNHPQEALNMLDLLVSKAEELKQEIEQTTGAVLPLTLHAVRA